MESQGDEIDWNAAYLGGETPWEKGGPAPPLAEFLERETMSGRVFVPGCGFGHDVRALSASGAAEVVGLDISTAAIERAGAIPLVGAEEYRLGDLFDLPAEFLGHFDWVFEHTCLSALAPAMRDRYIAALHSVLKPDGNCFAIYFLNPWDDDEIQDPPPYGITVEEIDAMIDGRFETTSEWAPGQYYPGREGRELCRLLRSNRTQRQ